MTWFRRLIRYGGASAVAAALAQVGLAAGYGWFRWTTTAAVGLSLVVSLAPSYWVNRRYVWPERSAGRSQKVTFVALAVVGSTVAAVTTHVAEMLGRLTTHDHGTLTLIVNGAALLTTIVVWLLRFVAFDRLVFTQRHAQAV